MGNALRQGNHNRADNLEKAHFQVDYVLTHEPSGRSSGYLSADTPLNGVNVFLDRVEDNVTFNAGFFGCLHLDKTISSRHRAIFRDIVPTGGEAAEPGAGDAAAERGTAAKARLIKEDTYDTTGSAPR